MKFILGCGLAGEDLAIEANRTNLAIYVLGQKAPR